MSAIAPQTPRRSTASDWHDSMLRKILWAGAALLWCVPVVASMLTREVQWSAGDFILFTAMLVAVAGAVELAARASPDISYRTAALLAAGTAFLLVFVNLAVGIIGSEDHPINLAYLAIPVLMLAGALLVRGRAAAMVRVMIATALLQVVVGGLALALGLNTWGALLGTGGFAALWLASAWLFTRAR